MKTLKKCPIDGSDAATALALDYADDFAWQYEMTGRNAMHLRLMAEELLGVVNGLTEVLDGSFSIEREGNEVRMKLSAQVHPTGEVAEHRLLHSSFSKENVLYKGFTGKLRKVADWYARGNNDTVIAGKGNDTSDLFVTGGFADYGDFTNTQTSQDWLLSRVRKNAELEEKAKNWDELEWSVLARLADDVRVGLRFGEVEITVYKSF